jgi:hypothetical protein
VGADLVGWGEACAAVAASCARAGQSGAEAELSQVVAEARTRWPRDTGQSAAQLVVRPTPTGARVVLTGYAPYVRRSGVEREAWLELVADRVDPQRAATRIAEEVGDG